MNAELVVAGGGLAGAAVACQLARAGRKVVVFEREAEPVDKICGEFISAEAAGYLKRLGLDLAALGGHPIGGFRLIRGESVASCQLPFQGLGLSRRVLDEKLLGLCEGFGAELRRGRTLRVRPERGGLLLREDGGAEFAAGTVFLATGKHDVNRLRRKVRAVPDLIGIKLHLRLSPSQQAALAGHVEILLLQDGYCGLQLVEHGMANLCLLVGRAQFLHAGGTCEAMLETLRRIEPHLARRLDGSTPLMARPLTIARVPYGFVHRPGPGDPDNLFRIGDQVAVIPSFTGDGMSIALHSAALAASCHLLGMSAHAYHHRIRSDVARQIALADLLYRTSMSPPARTILMNLAQAFPTGLVAAARLTRVSPAALARAA
jgi:flavin-dependent dehydrogenase